MRLQLCSITCLSMLVAAASAQPADPARSTSDDYGAAALARVRAITLAESSAQAASLDAFAAEPVDPSWAPRMMSRIQGQLGESELEFAALRSECRSTACVVEFTSSITWTEADDRERFAAEFNQLWGALARESGPEDVTASAGNISYDPAQECRLAGIFVLQRYPDVAAPRSPVRVDLADAARCSP